MKIQSVESGASNLNGKEAWKNVQDHMTLSDRVRIQSGLEKSESFKKMANAIDKDCTTVSAQENPLPDALKKKRGRPPKKKVEG